MNGDDNEDFNGLVTVTFGHNVLCSMFRKTLMLWTLEQEVQINLLQLLIWHFSVLEYTKGSDYKEIYDLLLSDVSVCVVVLFLQNPNTAVCGSKHGLIIGQRGRDAVGRMGGRLKLREGRRT